MVTPMTAVAKNASVRGAVRGALSLECPFCHESYQYPIRNKRYRVQCKTSSCRRVFYIGLRILTLATGDAGDVVPEDMIVPVLRWRDEKRLNELVER